MADLDAEFQTTAKDVAKSQQALQDRLARQKADDQSHIAKLIVWAFVVFIGVVVVAVIAGTVYLGWDKLTEPAKFLMGILGSVMLPVVTLIIGHYFGKEK